MIRKQAMQAGLRSKDAFRQRGQDVSRLEGFSDAVFAFAVTLLVVSLEVPNNAADLFNNMKDLLPFAVCFAALLYLWYRHYSFFRRYGLHDTTTILLNSILLFVILAYVYPLKFVFRVFLGPVFDEQGIVPPSPDQWATLFFLYGLGFAAVYVMFAAFHLHAYRQRAALELNPEEELITRAAIYANLSIAAIGILSAVVGLTQIGLAWGLPGWLYFLITPVMTIFGRWEGRRHRELSERLAAQG